MKKWFYGYLAVLGIMFTSLEAESMTIHGTVLNGSRENQPLPEGEVRLTRYTKGQKDESFQRLAQVDSTGQYRFQVRQSDSNAVYIPISTYAGVEYSGPGISLAGKMETADIIVYDTTAVDSEIWVPMHHILIEPGIGELTVKEIMLFENRGNHTYVGHKPAGAAKPKTLKMTTFPGAVNLETGGDLMSCCAITEKDRVFDSMEFIPGVRNMVIAYTLSNGSDELIWLDTLNYATGNYDVFVADGPVTLNVNRVKRSGVSVADSVAQSELFQIQERKYKRVHLADVDKGDVIQLTLSNLPQKPRDLKYLAPVLLVLVILGLSLWNRKGHQPE